MKKIIIIGGGGHAKVVCSIIKKNKEFDIVGFVDIKEKKGLLGVPYLGSDKILEKLFNEGITNIAMGIGQIKLADTRKSIILRLTKIGFTLPSIISKDSIVAEDVKISSGTVVMDGAIVCASTSIGSHCIINTNSSIDHDSILGDYVHIAPGVTLSGGVVVGNNVLIGSGSNVVQSVKICNDVLVGAGTLIDKSISHAGCYVGVPFKRMRDK